MAEKEKAPLIGADFSGPQDNAPRIPSLQSKDPQPAKEPVTTGVEEIPDEIPPVKSKPLTAAEKAEEYKQNLKELDIPIEKARVVLDNVIFNKAHVEDIVVGGKLRIGLRTRVYQDLRRIMHVLEAEAPSYPVHTQDLVARYNVAASLAYYGETKFDFPDFASEKEEEVMKAFDARMNFLLSLPSPIVNRLINETVKFDRMVEAIFAEGAPEDF
jgi:hypothetical protein